VLVLLSVKFSFVPLVFDRSLHVSRLVDTSVCCVPPVEVTALVFLISSGD